MRDELVKNVLGVIISFILFIVVIVMGVIYRNLLVLAIFISIINLFVFSGKILELIITINNMKNINNSNIGTIVSINDKILKYLYIALWPIVGVYFIYRYFVMHNSKLLLYGILLILSFIYTLYKQNLKSKIK